MRSFLGFLLLLYVRATSVSSLAAQHRNIAGSVREETQWREDQDALDFIAARLAERRIMDSARCNNWGGGYSEVHRKILQAPYEEQRFLVAVPHLSGMADRIVGFATCFLIATLTGRAFQMGRRHQLPMFELAFYSPNINWTRAQDPDWLLEPLKLKAVARNYNESVLSSKEYYAVNLLDDWRYQDALVRGNLTELMGGTARTTLMVSNRGKTIQMFNNPYYAGKLRKRLTPYTAFGCSVNFLIQPKPEIFLPFLEQFQIMAADSPTVLKISLQLRVGDWSWEDKNRKASVKSFERFFSCAQQIENFAMRSGNYTTVRWYLATESLPLRHAAVKAYGNKIVTSLTATLEHSAKESSVCNHGADGKHCQVSHHGFTAAAAEWWMLGYADYHVITRYSGYGRSGAFRTAISDTVYTIHESPLSCDENSFSPLDEIMYDWSGIR